MVALNNFSPVGDHDINVYPDPPGRFKEQVVSISTSQTKIEVSQAAALTKRCPRGSQTKLVTGLCSILFKIIALLEDGLVI